MKKICILGAGAMGCLIGGLIQRAGYDVTYIARGAQLQALKQHGLRLQTEGDSWHGPVRATDSANEAGPQDLVIICTKAYQLESVMPLLKPLLHAETVVLPAVNGVPWWYFQKHGGIYDGRRLTSLDPDGALERDLPAHHVIGCVNYLAGNLTQPGEVHYVPAIERRIHIGEIDGSMSPRLEAVAEIFKASGLTPVVVDSIRQSVWHKLWGNISFNPIGALTHGTIDQIAEGYRDTDLLSVVMNEARFVADKLGVELTQTIRSRIESAAKMRGHKTSMQVDIEQGRATEIEAIVGAVREIARWLEVDTPCLNVLYSLVRLKEKFYHAAIASHA